MNNAESAQIVDFVVAADGRNITPQTYGAWHLVIGHLDFEQARTATLMALQDTDIRWVEPKHILGKVAKLIANAEADARRAKALGDRQVQVGSPMRVCKHNLGLLYCQPCCHQAAIDAGLIPDRPMREKITLQ